MRSATLVIAIAALLGACGAPAMPRSPTAEATAVPSAPEPATPPEAIAPTRICEIVHEADGIWNSCTEAIGRVLLALGPDARSVQAAWFRLGSPCPPNARCVAPPPGSAYVVLRLEGARIAFVRLVIADGEVKLGMPENPSFDLWPASGQPIPPVGRPDVGPGAPAEVADREALPLCADERVGVFSRRAGRMCFLGAVQDGRPAELASQEVDSDGNAIVALYRFAGRGPVLVYRSAAAPGAGWLRNDCAIGVQVDEQPGDGDFLFAVSECLSTHLP